LQIYVKVNITKNPYNKLIVRINSRLDKIATLKFMPKIKTIIMRQTKDEFYLLKIFLTNSVIDERKEKYFLTGIEGKR
jgi:hypothetical protein